MNVLPLPVAIWIRDRGRLSARDASRFWMALDLDPPETLACSAAASAAAAPALAGRALTRRISSSGRWKVKTSRLRASGSRALVNCVTVPVDS